MSCFTSFSYFVLVVLTGCKWFHANLSSHASSYTGACSSCGFIALTASEWFHVKFSQVSYNCSFWHSWHVTLIESGWFYIKSSCVSPHSYCFCGYVISLTGGEWVHLDIVIASLLLLLLTGCKWYYARPFIIIWSCCIDRMWVILHWANYSSSHSLFYCNCISFQAVSDSSMPRLAVFLLIAISSALALPFTL